MQLVHFPLHPETPAEGASLAELFAGRDVDLDAMYARMKALMDEEQLPYSARTHTYNSRLAQELGKWADTEPAGERFHDAMYRAYFVDTLNIADPAVLLDVVAGLDMDVDAARSVLQARSFSPARRRGLGQVAPLRHYRRADVCCRHARRRWRATVRGAGAAGHAGGGGAARRLSCAEGARPPTVLARPGIQPSATCR